MKKNDEQEMDKKSAKKKLRNILADCLSMLGRLHEKRQ